MLALMFYSTSFLFTLWMFSMWKTNDLLNSFCKMYTAFLVIYFGYNAFMHETFQTLLK